MSAAPSRAGHSCLVWIEPRAARVDLQVAPSETVGLLGRNGMGKSTLIRTMLGLVRQREGPSAFRWRGRLARRTARVAARGWVVPEGRGVFPNLTVRENLVVAARAGVGRARRMDARSRARALPRLSQRLSHAGSALSCGEQQMLSIGARDDASTPQSSSTRRPNAWHRSSCRTCGA